MSDAAARAFVPVAGPFRLDLALRYLAGSPSTIAERVTEQLYERAFLGPAGPAVARVTADGPGVRVEVFGPGAGAPALARAVELAGRTFGLDLDPSGLDAVAGRDPVFGPTAARYRGLRVLTIPDPFEAVVWAILGQQINVAFAARTKRALLERYGQPVAFDGRTYRLFPTPDRLVDRTPEELRELQISGQKARYIAGLARAVLDGELDLEALRSEPDEAVVERLTRLKGIGRWTAEYLLLRGFGRPDAIPAADMGLRIVAGRLHGLGRNATEAEMRALAEPWRPWRGYYGFYLWYALQRRDW